LNRIFPTGLYFHLLLMRVLEFEAPLCFPDNCCFNPNVTGCHLFYHRDAISF